MQTIDKQVVVAPTGRPDIRGDARKVAAVLSGGGVAVIPGDVGYGLMGSDGPALRRMFETKRRASHKRHAMIGSWDLHADIHLLEDRTEDMINCITRDYDLPLGVVAQYRPDHPMIRNIDPATLRASTVEGTISILINSGRFQDELIAITQQTDLPVMGSSANLTGTGTKFTIEDIQPDVLGICDIVINYGLRKYFREKRSSTIFDFTRMEVVRIGCCYDVIRDLMGRYFSVELPPDPGVAVLPSGHLREPPPILS